MKEEEQPEPTLFEKINIYLKDQAPSHIKDPTVHGIASELDIPRDILDLWLKEDRQFREEMTRLYEYQTSDSEIDGTEMDYYVHAAGIQFVLIETKKRYSV